MPEPNRPPMIQKVAKIALAIVAPLFLISLSIAPLLSAFQSTDSQAGISPELLQQEIEGYQAVLEREPDNRIALSGLVELSLQSGDLAVALDPLEKMVELEPEDLNLRLLLAQIKMQSGDTAGALEQYEQMVVDFPDNPRIEQELLNAKVRAGDFEGAIAMLQQQIAEDPESTDIRRDLAATYVQANQPEAALPIYDELIAEDPTDYSYLLGKGMALSVMADDEANFDEAQDFFAQALRLAPPQQREQVEQITEFYSQLATANSQVSVTTAPSPDPSSELDSTSEPSPDSSAD